ncbi:MAG: phasin family protein [Geminicoccaceae bacterium]|nr:MAG: phasin family protein [Geminicoccaceae bacterium]
MATETPKFEMPKFEMPKFANMDPEALMATHRRNLEAMTSASQILADGMKTLAQRQAEIMQARMSAFGQKVESSVKAKEVAPVDGQIDEVKAAYEQMLADTKELVEIVAKAQTEALQVVNHCLLANFDDMKKLAA